MTTTITTEQASMIAKLIQAGLSTDQARDIVGLTIAVPATKAIPAPADIRDDLTDDLTLATTYEPLDDDEPEAPAPKAKRKPKHAPDASRDPRLPPVGTTIRRPYKGTVYQLLVTADGFELDGETFTGLSTAARSLTGHETNGFRFFKLTKPWGEPEAKPTPKQPGKAKVKPKFSPKKPAKPVKPQGSEGQVTVNEGTLVALVAIARDAIEDLKADAEGKRARTARKILEEAASIEFAVQAASEALSA